MNGTAQRLRREARPSFRTQGQATYGPWAVFSPGRVFGFVHHASLHPPGGRGGEWDGEKLTPASLGNLWNCWTFRDRKGRAEIVVEAPCWVLNSMQI